MEKWKEKVVQIKYFQGMSIFLSGVRKHREGLVLSWKYSV
jgi:hypothetical protein